MSACSGAVLHAQLEAIQRSATDARDYRLDTRDVSEPQGQTYTSSSCTTSDAESP
jgi:hypothetical protein